jgi:uncharacterized protein with HEPN domain
MRLEVKKYLYDIQQASELLARFTSGKALGDYSADPLLRSGVERQFEVIGEALGQMLKIEPGLSGDITESKRIIAFRNVLIHAYASVSDEVVWDILGTDLPRLRKEVEALLRSVS